jgi:hypothetical protein
METMAKIYDEITEEIADWLEQQRMFFVATAPGGTDGHINCSPKGHDTFRILSPGRVGYLDLTGSGAETIAHIRDNGRIVFMFCALEGPPQIVRLHGRATVVRAPSPEWDELSPQFPELAGARSIIVADITRVADSCGYSIPRYEFVEPRDSLLKLAAKRGPEGVAAAQQRNNVLSIDGLPALEQE